MFYEKLTVDMMMKQLEDEPALKSVGIVVECEWKCIRDAIQEEIYYDIENAADEISHYGSHFIHYDDVVIPYGQSKAVAAFLEAANEAHQTKHVKVICCETYPSLAGQQFALELSKKGISTLLIHDAAAFTVMSRCNKVVIGCHAVLANGGVLVPSGGYNVVIAALHSKVPVIVLTGMYKLYPQFCSDQTTINDIDSPNHIMPYSLCDSQLAEVDVVNPVYDYIPPEYISLILTTKGKYAPSYIFRLMKENYTDEDILLSLNSRFGNN